MNCIGDRPGFLLRQIRRRNDRAWRNRVDEDSVLCKLERQRLRERFHASLGDVVRHEPGVPGPATRGQPVGEMHDVRRRSAPEQWQGGAGDVKRRREVVVDVGAPGPLVDLHERPRHVRGRHVDDDVEAAELPIDRVRERRTVGWSAHVGLDDDRAPVERPDACGRLLGFLPR
jgi:hypothetical protein